MEETLKQNNQDSKNESEFEMLLSKDLKQLKFVEG